MSAPSMNFGIVPENVIVIAGRTAGLQLKTGRAISVERWHRLKCAIRSQIPRRSRVRTEREVSWPHGSHFHIPIKRQPVNREVATLSQNLKRDAASLRS